MQLDRQGPNEYRNVRGGRQEHICSLQVMNNFPSRYMSGKQTCWAMINNCYHSYSWQDIAFFYVYQNWFWQDITLFMPCPSWNHVRLTATKWPKKIRVGRRKKTSKPSLWDWLSVGGRLECRDLSWVLDGVGWVRLAAWPDQAWLTRCGEQTQGGKLVRRPGKRPHFISDSWHGAARYWPSWLPHLATLKVSMADPSPSHSASR